MFCGCYVNLVIHEAMGTLNLVAPSTSIHRAAVTQPRDLVLAFSCTTHTTARRGANLLLGDRCR